MTARPLYSSLDLRGLPLTGVGLPEGDTDAVTRGYLEFRLAAVEAQLSVVQDQLTQAVTRLEQAEARDQVVVSSTDPGAVRGLWVQTGLGADGTDMTLWVKDGG